MKRLHLAALAIAASAAVIATPSASPIAARSSIVFVAGGAGGNHLFVVGSNGAGRRQLTGGTGFDLVPAWSPSRSHVAFATTRASGSAAAQDVFLVRADGSGMRPLVQTDRDEAAPSWAPSGRSVVFERDTTGRGQYDLYIVTVATGEVRRLTTSRLTDSAPSWSPSGRWIAFSRAGQIWLIRPDGTGAHGLGRLGWGIDTSPDWSPDGSRIVFETSSRTNPARPVPQIWVMRSDGSRKQELTRYDKRRPVAATTPSWSPGGAQIVFTRAFRQLWTMRPDGTRLRQLTRTPAGGWSADW